MTLWKPDEILNLLGSAGAIGLKHVTAPATELKTDRSVVTVADREIEALLAARFDRPKLGSYMIGEETVSSRDEEYLSAALNSSVCYVVDPIDGTAPYTIGLPLWGVSIGLMEQGVLTEGAFYLPVQDEAFVTCRGTLWYARGLQIATPEVVPFHYDSNSVVPGRHISISQLSARRWRFDLSNQLFAWSSCVGSYYHLLKGNIAAYLQSSRLWDLAGGVPVLRAAGIEGRFFDGRPFEPKVTHDNFELAPGPFRWRLREHVLFTADPALFDEIRQHTRVVKE